MKTQEERLSVLPNVAASNATPSMERHIEEYLKAHIPLTNAIALSVKAFDGESLSVSVPLAPNINHRSTAFGGSIATLGITTNWALLHFCLRQKGYQKAQIVIQKSEVDFLAPADGDLEAKAAIASVDTLTGFITRLERFGRARIELIANITCNSKLVATHKGAYVGLLKKVNTTNP